MSLITILIVIIYISSDTLATEWERYVAASTNDLSRLFQKENNMIREIDQWTYQVQKDEIPYTTQIKEDLSLIQKTFVSLKLDEWRFDNSLEYTSHPINSYHLLKRTTKLWPILYENITSQALEDIFEERLKEFPELDDYNYGACVGLVNIELYYSQSGSTFRELAKGRVKNPINGKIHQARHGLTSEDFNNIAEAARRGTLPVFLYGLIVRLTPVFSTYINGSQL